MQNIYLNDLGIINALGQGKSAVVRGLLDAQVSAMALSPQILNGKSTYVGQVLATLEPLSDDYHQYDCRNNRLLAAVYQQIAATVEKYKHQYGMARIGVVLGTSTSGIAAGEAAFRQYQLTGSLPEQFIYKQQEIGNCSEFLARYIGVQGAYYTISTACSSSGKAIASAMRLLQAGIYDVVIAGGSDSLCGLTLNGFAGLESIASTLCNPFSANRNGINIGEGAALFVLSRNASAIKLSGVGESSDGYHITAPDPHGRGARLAITQALAQAQCLAQDIGYINLHGTATNKNDAMESQVLADLFPMMPYCSSTKPCIGHTLGAAGAQELGLCWLLLHEQYNPTHLLPAQIWDGISDINLPTINLLKQATQWKIPRFMSNNFAFGGSNVSLILERSNTYDSL